MAKQKEEDIKNNKTKHNYKENNQPKDYFLSPTQEKTHSVKQVAKLNNQALTQVKAMTISTECMAGGKCLKLVNKLTKTAPGLSI